MKFMYKVSILFSSLLFCSNLLAQRPILLVEEDIEFSHGTYIGLSLTIPELKYNEVAKSWEKLLEKGTKSKIQIEDGEYTIFGAQINDISSEPINVYSILRSVDTSVVLKATFELKPKQYVSKQSSPSEYTQARVLLMSFGKDMYADLAKNELKEQEKALRQLEKDQESLYNQQNRMEKSIVNDNSDITEYTDAIALLKQDADNLNAQLLKEKQLLMELEDEDQRLAKEKEIKEIEKNRDKALKEVDNLEKKIRLRQSSIEKAKDDIEHNKQEQVIVLDAIEKQKAITSEAERKYNNILSY